MKEPKRTVAHRRGRFWVTAPAGVPPEKLPPSYARFAEVFDAALGNAFHDAFWPVLKRVLEEYPPPGRAAVDLGCGTGTLCLRLAAEGYFPTGLERSPDMLRIAREKVRRAGALVTILEGDLRQFTLPRPVDAAFVTYDTLNHLLTTQDLIRAFGRISANLVTGGLLYADFNTRAAYETTWADPEPWVHEGEEHRLEIHSRYDREARIGTAELEIRSGTDGGERQTEEVRQRFFTDDEIRGTMWAGGIDPVACVPFDTLPPEDRGPDPMKALWVGRARGGRP